MNSGLSIFNIAGSGFERFSNSPQVVFGMTVAREDILGLCGNFDEHLREHEIHMVTGLHVTVMSSKVQKNREI